MSRILCAARPDLGVKQDALDLFVNSTHKTFIEKFMRGGQLGK